MKLGFPVIDLHTHLRDSIQLHTKIAKESGIDVVVYMANCKPPLDNLNAIKKSLKEKRYCKAIPVSAITKDLEGKKVVDIDKIGPYVVGFSDDGKCLKDLEILKYVLRKKVLVLAHLELETAMLKRYISIYSATGGYLHFQHISKKESVELIKFAKKDGLKITCETCPHYFTYTKEELDTKVNPSLGSKEDVFALREGLSNGTIDVIASDYAPLPRKTGIAGFRSFLPLSYGLVLDGTLSKKQLREKLYLNPKKIIESGGYKLKI